MPTATSREPTIGEIYGAYSVDSHRVFQAAMGRSRGGVVRVEDLLSALFELHNDLGRQVLPTGWRAPLSTSRADDGLVPMANEPALRETLRLAFQIAAAQPGDAAAITPSVLWAAVVLRRRLAAGPSADELFSRLHLHCPAALRAVVTPESSRPTAPTIPTPSQLEELFDPRNLLDVVLERWLAAQSLPTGSARDQELARIAALARHLESQP